MHKEALRRAVQIVGSQSLLARKIGNGVTQAHVHYWLTRASVVPAQYCPKIEHIVGRQVMCEDLNPKVDWWVLRCCAPSAARAMGVNEATAPPQPA